MSDEVKFIFKTLLKVPIIIVVSFLILNLFAFFFVYFKVLGLSYVVMQTAVENNYLPKTEVNTLCNYAYTFEDIPMVTNAAIIVGRDSSNNYEYTQTAVDTSQLISGSDDDSGKNAIGDVGTKNYNYHAPDSGDANTALHKVQYGKPVTVGVHCGYKLVWPLGYKETIDGVDATGTSQGVGDGVQGFDGTGVTAFKGTAQLENDRADKETLIQFDICHTVPGLKYYPDLLSN